MTASVFAVFVKTPGLSLSKTRLGQAVGVELAQEGYERLLDVFFETWCSFENERRGQVRLVLAVAEDLEAARATQYWQQRCARWGVQQWEMISQVAPDADLGVGVQAVRLGLGDRIATVWSELELRGRHVFILGSDSPGLLVSDLESAVAQVGERSGVMGRARDGGFYLFGARSGEFDARGWKGIAYSCSTTADELMNVCGQAGLQCHSLRTLSDLDEWSDLDVIEQEVTVRGTASVARAGFLVWLKAARERVK